MDIEQLATIVGSLGMWVTGFVLFAYERRRSARLQDARIRELKQIINMISKSEIFPTVVNGNEDMG